MLSKDQLKEKYKDEKVFVLPANLVQNVNDKFTKQAHTQEIWTKFDNIGQYIYRYDAEYNPAFQQVIPYFLIENKDGSKYYVGKRIQGDDRLQGKLSLGFGGHINECDGYSNMIIKALTREMHEELNIDPISPFRYIGTMKDLTSETNDHFGLIFVIKSEEDTISIKETNNLEGVWMTKEEMYNEYGRFENWSKYILDYLYES